MTRAGVSTFSFRPAGEEPHLRSLLRGGRLRGHPDCRRRIVGPYELDGMHGIAPARG